MQAANPGITEFLEVENMKRLQQRKYISSLVQMASFLRADTAFFVLSSASGSKPLSP